MKDRRIRFALIGCGDFAAVFAAYITEAADLVAICDPSSDARTSFRQSTHLAVKEFEDYERLLSEVDIDAVAITSPNHTHKQITMAAAQAGKHVYCEKAMAHKVSDCWEMVRACESAGVRLMVGHKRRLRPPWARMIELRETLGPPLAITDVLYHDARPYNFQGWWTREAQSGGLLDIAGVHELDWMRAMAGEVKSVSAIAGPQADHRYDFSDTLHVQLQFRSGTVAALSVSLAYPPLKFREACGAQVVCLNGGIRLATYLEHIDLYWQHNRDNGLQHTRYDDLGFDYAFSKEVGDFVRWIKDGTGPCLTWVEGLRCVEVIEAANRSARENGAWVGLPLYPELEMDSKT
jgi:predicted dehydrogenase